MPLKLPLTVALAAAGLLLASGCQSSKALPPPKSTSTLVLTPNNRQVLSTLPLYGQLQVFLPAPQNGPGYSWVVVSNNVRVLPQTAMLQPVPKPTPDRAYAATFRAVYPGRSILRFAAIKPGQTESEPDDIYQVAVGVKPQ